MKLSVVAPVFNEEEIVEELVRRIASVLDEVPGGPHEIVITDDGSSDRTVEILGRIAQSEPRLMVVELSRNFGHQAAFSAALDHCTGDAVVMMDGDLQDSPEEIPRFLAKIEEGYDVVYARRVGRKENWLLRTCYFMFYRILSRLSNIEMPLDSGDFSMLSRRAVDEIKRLNESNRYLRGLRTWVGFRQTGVEVERAAREAGTSKYSLGRLLGLAFDGMLAFSVAPLRAAALMGFGAMSLAAIYAVYAVFVKLMYDRSPEGFTALIVVMVFLFGLQFLFLGVVGEYVGRIYDESKRRPHYIVARVSRGGSGATDG